MRQDGHTYTGPINAAMRCAITLCSGHHYSLAPSLPPCRAPLRASYANLITSPLPLQISLSGNLCDLTRFLLLHETFLGLSHLPPNSSPSPSSCSASLPASSYSRPRRGCCAPPRRLPSRPFVPFSPSHQSIGSLLWLPGQRRASGPTKIFYLFTFFPFHPVYYSSSVKLHRLIFYSACK